MRICLAVSIVALSCVGAMAQETPKADVRYLVETLGHKSQAIRKKAADELAGAGAAAVPPLMVHVRTGEMRDACVAAVVLGRMKGDGVSAAEGLLAMLRDPATAGWRWSVAAQTLGRIAPAARKEALSASIDALRSGDPLKQQGALSLLTALGPEGGYAVPALQELLNSRRHPFRSVVLDDKVIDDDAPSFTEAVASFDALAILETMRKVGASTEQVAGPLKELATHRDEGVRLLAAQQLSRLDDASRQAAAAAFVSLMTDRRPTVRETAVAGAGALGEAGAPAVSALCRLLEASDPELRELSAVALGEIGPAAKAQGVPALEKAIRAETLVASDNSPLAAGARARVEKMNAAVGRITGAEK